MLEPIDPTRIAHSERVSHIIETFEAGLAPGEPIINDDHRLAIEDEMYAFFTDPERIGTEPWQVSHDRAVGEYNSWHAGFFHEPAELDPGETAYLKLRMLHPNRHRKA